MRPGSATHVPARASELTNRLAVAAIGLPIVALILVTDARASAWLFSAAAAVGCWEYTRLALRRIEPIASIGIAAAAVMPLLPAYVRGPSVGTMLFVVVAAATMGIWTVALFTPSRETAPERVGHVLSALLFSTVGMVALSSLRAAADGVAWAVVVLVTTWSNDTFAYLGGRVLGRHKLWPSVSPHKTWEGLVVGFLGGVLGPLVIRRWLPREMTPGLCLAIGVVGGVAAPVGDLCKSVLKRAYHVKDTSRLLPGHGGVLDRIDGVLFVAPVLWLMRALWLSR